MLAKAKSPDSRSLKNIESYKKSTNTYTQQLNELKIQKNPYDTTIASIETQVATNKKELVLLGKDAADFTSELSDLELLITTNDLFRSLLIKNSIINLESSTNNLLSTYFDAELRVSFDVSSSDKLDIEITKDGNLCSYTQLSKGQRQLLKLCFAISMITAISNHQGVDFNCIFLDEPFDGLDTNMRIKAFGLLDSLSTKHESVFCVEHNEAIKSRFLNEIKVELVNGRSKIEKA
jgi:DNA repair exonuclease SbcCD ATPase subunit